MPRGAPSRQWRPDPALRHRAGRFPALAGRRTGDARRSDGDRRGALAKHAAFAREKAGIEAEPVIREGVPVEQIHALIEEDQDIAILVLAAGAAKEGPGPLVSSIAGRNAAFPIPVTVVPYNLSDEDIESLS
jgi:nucleotide-binding universal stress UspA family protein